MQRIDPPLVDLFDSLGSQAGKNDNYGFALSAQPGKSQGRPASD
jgi:hypothetical protein